MLAKFLKTWISGEPILSSQTGLSARLLTLRTKSGILNRFTTGVPSLVFEVKLIFASSSKKS